MERKTDQFFDWDKLMTAFSQHPDQMDKIVEYVVDKVEHFTEFKVKKEHLKDKYDHKLKDLYAEYMTE